MTSQDLNRTTFKSFPDLNSGLSRIRKQTSFFSFGRLLSFLSFATLLGTLSGCISLLPDSGKTYKVYTLSQPERDSTASLSSPPIKTSEKSQKIVMIHPPSVPPYLRTDRLALIHPGEKLSYLAGVRWASPTSRLLQDLFFESLSFNKDWTVLRPGTGVLGNYILSMDLLDFSAHGAEGSPPVIRFRLKVILIDASQRTLIASQIFEEDIQAQREGVSSVVMAFDQASQGMAQKISGWLESALRHQVPPVSKNLKREQSPFIGKQKG